MSLPKTISVQKVEKEFYQDSDSCDSSDLGQTLNVWTEDSGAGKYLCISTERWAIDDIDELVAILQDMKRYCDET